MTTNTKELGSRPNASIDFNKVHENCKAGKEDPFAGAVAEVKLDAETKAALKAEADLADASATSRAKDAGFDSAEAFAESLAGPRVGDSTAEADGTK